MRRRVFAVICAGLGLWLIWTALPLVEHSLHTRPGDGAVDWLGARAWLAHVNVYSPEGLAAYGLTPYGFAHPPTAPFWLIPFAPYDVDMLGTLMGYVTLLGLTFHLFATTSTLRLPAPIAVSMLALGLLLHASFVHDDLVMAQVSEPIALMYLLAWLALRSEQDLAAGVAIGLACTFKPFAGVLWLMLLSLRRWRAAVAAAIAWLAIAAVMTSRFGLIAWLQWNAFNKQTALVWLGHLRNATLPGLVLRAAHPICKGGSPPRLGPTLVASVLGLAVLIACHRLSRPARADRPADPIRLDLLFAAWSAASVFVNPVAWEHYAFILILPIGILLAAAADSQRPRADRLIGLATAGACVALLAIDMHAKVDALHQRSPGWPHVKLHLLEAANWLPWAIVLVAALVLAARSKGPKERPYGS